MQLASPRGDRPAVSAWTKRRSRFHQLSHGSIVAPSPAARTPPWQALPVAEHALPSDPLTDALVRVAESEGLTRAERDLALLPVLSDLGSQLVARIKWIEASGCGAPSSALCDALAFSAHACAVVDIAARVSAAGADPQPHHSPRNGANRLAPRSPDAEHHYHAWSGGPAESAALLKPVFDVVLDHARSLEQRACTLINAMR